MDAGPRITLIAIVGPTAVGKTALAVALAGIVNILDPEVIALVRIVIARSICDPQFARQFFERTANPTRDALQDVFARWQADGVAMVGSPAFLAEMFMGLFVSDLQTAVDSGDPINHVAGAQADVPLHLMEVTGDTVVPNSATDRLIAAGGLDKLTALGADVSRG